MKILRMKFVLFLCSFVFSPIGNASIRGGGGDGDGDRCSGSDFLQKKIARKNTEAGKILALFKKSMNPYLADGTKPVVYKVKNSCLETRYNGFCRELAKKHWKPTSDYYLWLYEHHGVWYLYLVV